MFDYLMNTFLGIIYVDTMFSNINVLDIHNLFITNMQKYDVQAFEIDSIQERTLITLKEVFNIACSRPICCDRINFIVEYSLKVEKVEEMSSSINFYWLVDVIKKDDKYSHDCHVLMTQLLLIVLSGVLRINSELHIKEVFNMMH
ncbi:hypothetical protein ACJX0J_030359 [Zea mays]